MNTLVRVLYVFAAIPLLIGGCAALPAPAEQGEQVAPRAAIYESILGKSLSDVAVVEFLASNECSSADRFLLCNAAGMALWTDSNQVVETVYLYLNDADGFAAYKGELPYGLKFYDIMGAVEYKLKKQGVGKAGLPDEGATPDHLRYRATYHRAGMTIIYNSPSPEDEDATIYAILLSN
jgi:hypothetical protein